MKVRYNRVSELTQQSSGAVRHHIKKQFIVARKKVDIVPFNQRIANAAKDKNLSVALQQWEKIEELGGVPTPHTYCAMVNAFVRCGQLRKAEELVEKMEKCVTVNDSTREGYIITLTALLKGYFMSSAFERSHALFGKIMSASQGRVSSRTLDTYLRGCLRTGAFEHGLSAYNSPRTEKSEMSGIYAGKMLAIRLAVKSSCEVGGSNDAALCVHIGCAYVRVGKQDRAVEWFGRAKELLFTSTPDRQFDKLQKSELVRICDFFTSDEYKSSNPSNPVETYLCKFLSFDATEQVQLWTSLGLGKYMSDSDIQSESINALSNLKQELKKTKKSVILEVCSGSGEWIAREASQNRDKIYIAVEFRFDRCVDILTRQIFQQLDNLWILCGDARKVVSTIPPGCLEELHVNYPEPPPVNVSHIDEEMSSDIVTRKFLDGIRPLIKGSLHIVSDDKLYMHTVANLVGDAWGKEIFPKSQKTLVDSYFARFFSKKAKRWSIDVLAS
jgi:tRNA (guanine-N7-)-methyltransferase